MNNTTPLTASQREELEFSNVQSLTISLGGSVNERLHKATQYKDALTTALILYYEADMANNSTPECSDIVSLIHQFDGVIHSLRYYKQKIKEYALS